MSSSSSSNLIWTSSKYPLHSTTGSRPSVLTGDVAHSGIALRCKPAIDAGGFIEVTSMINVRRRMAQRRPRGRSGHAAAIATLAIALGLANADARSASIVQPDLRIEKIGAVTQGVPAQMVFGPDHRLYVSLANLDASRPNAASVVSFGYDPTANLAGERAAAATGGAIGVAFGPVTLGNYGERGAITTTGMYLTDTARNGNANLRVLTANATGFYGGFGGTNTVIAANIPAGFHEADQLLVKRNRDGSSSLFVGSACARQMASWTIHQPGARATRRGAARSPGLRISNASTARWSIQPGSA